ncbi:carboxymuconolactone decarboxylase family protein [Nocardioides sp. URHA0032]|uniref:carboxymuconolactone decarboxylase family protein n=1 Tax=Nocardioides sp. URHA0032 TaxID=1380388 RepID=UPI000686B723|nr:carboxymuconolactone decarboxylase family protein [Nocardioides sp. URHA0032]
MPPSTLPPSYGAVLGARRALDVGLTDPRVVAFAEQFAVDVSVIDDELRGGFLAATGPAAFVAVQAIFVDDFWPRVPAVLGPVGSPVEDGGELWPALEEFMREVARLDALDPVTTELVRLRGARQHDCRVCRSRRSVAAIEQGADEATFEAVDRYADSDLPVHVKAALALTDAVIWTPYAVPADVAAAARSHLPEDQVVEVVLDVTRNAANKIAVALGADAPTVTDGVELFTTDRDGNLTVLGPRPR